MNIDITQTSPELFDTQAEDFAKAIDKNTKATQLRRFYDELVRCQQLLGKKEDQWDSVLPLVKMMNAKVAYARARNHVDEVFYTTFSNLIKQIQQPQHLKNCKLFLEATVGFRKLVDEENKNRNRRH